MILNDSVIFEGKTQADEDYTYTYKNINPAVNNATLKAAMQNLIPSLSRNSVLTTVRRHEEELV